MVQTPHRGLTAYLSAATITWLTATATAQGPEDGMNCFAVIAGKDCTVDGSVIFAHNEDSGFPRVVNFWKVPAQEHQDIERQRLIGGGSLEYAPKTHAAIWCQMPGLRYSDTYLNEHGVAVATNGCHSRENEPELTDGGITFMLRRIVATRATSARDGLRVAAELLARFGYADTGRTMTIADGKEAWIMNIARGKHWAAVRVPDDKCAAIANHFSIHHVDANDPENYQISPGLIEHAKKRGWYDPERDGSFDFATIYGTDGARKHRSNIRRAWRANSLISTGPHQETWRQPTFVTPKKKLRISDLMAVLRDHYEGTDYDQSEGYKKSSPYRNGPTICAKGTSFSTVFQLRANLPPAIGAVMWVAMGRPDASVYVPWYAGIQEIPAGYARGRGATALNDHFTPDAKEGNPPPGFHAITALETAMDPLYGAFFPRLDAARDDLENRMFAIQGEVERTAARLHANDPAAALDYLTAYTLGQQARTDTLVRTLTEELKALLETSKAPGDRGGR